MRGSQWASKRLRGGRLLGLLALALSGPAALAAPPPPPPVALLRPYVFTDESAVLTVSGDDPALVFTQQTITAAGGLSPECQVVALVTAHRLVLPPDGEGIHILRFATTPPVELRYLALDPPAPLDPVALRHALPLSGMRLLAGKPYLLLAMGDAVTATGDYAGILQLLLTRATGSREITVLNQSFPGRAVDASVRSFAAESVPRRPDLGLILYGLNDQSAGVTHAAYVEQYAWLARHLADDSLADTVLLQPTPCIDVATHEDQEEADFPAAAALRVLGYAAALRPLAAERHLPLAETFQALWGVGGPSIADSARRLWPLFPPAADRQFEALVESDGRGDTTHPNVLGHLAIARATYAAITGQPATPPPLALVAVNEWTATGLQTSLTVTNASDDARTGKLAVYPLAEQGPVTLTGDGAYDLEPGASATFVLTWPDLQLPADLLRYPASETLATGEATIPVVDFAAGGGQVYAVAATWAVPGGFVRERQELYGNAVTAVLQDGARRRAQNLLLPPDSEAGRLPLVTALHDFAGHEAGWAVAELTYVRAAQAEVGEATVDGLLDDWSGHTWSSLGVPAQARWIHGPEDHREQPGECALRWSCKAGEDALYLALHVTGKVEQDTFTVLFDPRAPAWLGTPGAYYWVTGTFKARGELALQRGDTSARAIGLAGAWRPTATGADVELRVPYDLMAARAWPAAGDLGLGLWWTHLGPQGRTHLQWSGDGYPWDPRTFGVVRRASASLRPLPYTVRIK